MSDSSPLRQAQGEAGSGRRPSTLERALIRLRRSRGGNAVSPTRLSAATFQATVNERLRSLELQVDEVKGRVNGLIFLLAGTVAAQLVLRLVG